MKRRDAHDSATDCGSRLRPFTVLPSCVRLGYRNCRAPKLTVSRTSTREIMIQFSSVWKRASARPAPVPMGEIQRTEIDVASILTSRPAEILPLLLGLNDMSGRVRHNGRILCHVFKPACGRASAECMRRMCSLFSCHDFPRSKRSRINGNTHL